VPRCISTSSYLLVGCPVGYGPLLKSGPVRALINDTAFHIIRRRLFNQDR
jgi:hypothetical protein